MADFPRSTLRPRHILEDRRSHGSQPSVLYPLRNRQQHEGDCTDLGKYSACCSQEFQPQAMLGLPELRGPGRDGAVIGRWLRRQGRAPGFGARRPAEWRRSSLCKPREGVR